MMHKKIGQIWIETVVYTIIGLTLIGVVLTFVTPKINEARDRSIVEQSIASLQILDDKVNEVYTQGIGSRRIISSFSLKRGTLTISDASDQIVLTLDGLSVPYSEPGIAVPYGRVLVLSTPGGKATTVTLTLDYSSSSSNPINIIYSGKPLTAGSIPYRLAVEHKATGVDLLKL